MPLRRAKSWTRYIRKSTRGYHEKHRTPASDEWRRLEQAYTVAFPIIASTAVQQAWQRPEFESVPREKRKEVNALLKRITAKILFSNMIDPPADERSAAKIKTDDIPSLLEGTEADRKAILRLLGERRSKILFSEMADLIHLLRESTLL